MAIAAARIRLLILNNVRSPSFDPLFAALAEEPDFDVDVCYLRQTSASVGWPELAEAPRYRMMRSGDGPWSRLRNLWRLIDHRNTDFVLIYGYSLWQQAVAIVLSCVRRVPFGIIGDSNVHCDHPRPWLRPVKTLWLTAVARRAAVVFPVGTAGRLFWDRYGAVAERTVLAPFAIDNEVFSSDGGGSADGALRLVFAGRLVTRKNVDVILQAMRELPQGSVSMVVIGDGPARASLEKLAASLRHPVHFLGKVPYAKLPPYYRASDVLVLPAADEPWGLVVNEAMASGLAVVVHRAVGAAMDLVSAENGILLNSFDAGELAAALGRLAGDRQLLARMKEASRERIGTWSFRRAAAAIASAVRAAGTRQ